jgi:tetratricopeptide (TPR) repeat protein
LGLAEFQRGDRDAAKKTFTEAAESPAGAPLADYFLALIAAGEGDWPRAAERAEAAVAHANDDTLARLLVAIAAIERGRYEKADAAIGPILDTDPLDAAAVTLARLAAERRGSDEEVRRLDARLKNMARLSPGQFRAGEATLERLRGGLDIDCLAGDTIRGSAELPGSEP